jgi:hypothetical protein
MRGYVWQTQLYEKNMIRKVCIPANPLTLLEYVLLFYYSLDETMFLLMQFFDKSLADRVGKNMFIGLPKNANRLQAFLFRIYVSLFNNIKWPYLKTADIYVGLLGFWPISLIRKKEFNLLDDGIFSYKKIIHWPFLKTKIKELLFGRASVIYSFNDPQIKKIYLSDAIKKNAEGSEKVIRFNFKELYDQYNEKEQRDIQQMFGLLDNDIDELKKRKIVLLTQPIDLDCGLSENEKIQVYAKILSNYQQEDVVIKPHPRERTDYKLLFPDYCIFSKKSVPMEIFELAGIKFDTAVTICSTAVLTLNYNIKIDWYGTAIHPKILKTFGNLRLEDFKKEI